MRTSLPGSDRYVGQQIDWGLREAEPCAAAGYLAVPYQRRVPRTAIGPLRTRFGYPGVASPEVATGYQGGRGVRTHALSVAAGQESTDAASTGSSADK